MYLFSGEARRPALPATRTPAHLGHTKNPRCNSSTISALDALHLHHRLVSHVNIDATKGEAAHLTITIRRFIALAFLFSIHTAAVMAEEGTCPIVDVGRQRS